MIRAFLRRCGGGLVIAAMGLFLLAAMPSLSGCETWDGFVKGMGKDMKDMGGKMDSPSTQPADDSAKTN
ncbi:MAG: hypothetical protein BIFFINMI_04144 [Phycisphaerae bacterium]|nr:hypothetical protein [Phycisphaerae bacterium]